MKLAKNYALPIITVDSQRENTSKPIDRIVASIAGTNTCIEITAITDPNTPSGVQKYLYDKNSHKTDINKAFFDPIVDLKGEATEKSTNKPVKGKNVQPKIEP
ncbi:MAG: hypothetical protein FWH37_09205 [Candidatus Bathyarchaeota archaeon]|nr:hypothetical protein [Candidatus Termiticorpusculum sp.]